jgi:predicted methyltransferase
MSVGAETSAVSAKDVAVVGLGAGTLAAYKDAFMAMTFYEIDPVVIRIAQDPRYFTFLSDAIGTPEIVEGDARLSLAKERDGQYDVIVLDAFSSDVVPVHLLTVEAITDQARVLTPDGVLAFHVSNRYYDLSEPIANALYGLGFTPLVRESRDDEIAGDPSAIRARWLVASRSIDDVNAFRRLGWKDAMPSQRPFTDDYADLFSHLRLID